MSHFEETPGLSGESEQRFRAVLEASPNAIIAVDQAARLIYANPQAVATFGYELVELIGLPIETLIPERLAKRHVGHRNGFLASPIARPMGIGLDLAGRRKDGSEFPVEISLSTVSTPDGPQVFATVVDITARKSAELGLAESEQRFRAVLEASPNAIVAIGEGGGITYANAQAGMTFGYDVDELIGQPVELLIPERVGDRHIGHRSGFFANPIARPMGMGLDLAGRRKDNSEFPVEISLAPVPTERGREVFATVVDITARKAAETQLLQAQKLESIGRLAGGIAHDFNNILFAIRGFGGMLSEDLDPEMRGEFDFDAARSSVDGITGAAERASSLTAQLLAFSRRQIVNPRMVDLNASVRAVEPMLRRLIEENVHLSLVLNPTIGSIRADPGQIDQVLVNLVVNARDAMPEGGTIAITTDRVEFEESDTVEHFEAAPGRYVQLAVSDTGHGMDEQTREHIFEPFFTTKGVGEGTGLGLATTYGIVRQAGGHIWLYSEPGQGSTFKLYFPEFESTAVESAPAKVPRRGSRHGTVMVVEDDPSVREMTSRLLERTGYRVLLMSDPIAALTMVSEGNVEIDLLVSDVVMPRMSGIQLAERMLALYPDLGVVLLSGYLAETLDLSMLTARGARFVSKPVSSRAFLVAVDEAMSDVSTGLPPPQSASNAVKRSAGDAGSEGDASGR